MIKRMLIMLVVLCFILAVVFGVPLYRGMMMGKAMKAMKFPATVVSAIKAQTMPWQQHIKAVGSLRAQHGVDVTSEIPGIVAEVRMKSGDQVKKGDILVLLNAQTDIALLRSLTISAQLAQTVYARDKKQFEAQAISRAVVDSDEAQVNSSQALADQQAALVRKKTICAPFAGKLGINRVNVGEYITPGEMLVTLQSLDVLLVDFNLPQQELARVSLDQEIVLTTDTYPGRLFTGKITAISPRVESDSRNFQVEAMVPNLNHELIPGMFVDLEVKEGGEEKRLTLPQTAVTFNPYGETVFVVDNNVAKQVFIETGETRGDQIAVVKGIKEGDWVVTSGQLKLHNGSPVEVDNTVVPKNDMAPQPQEQ
ncbi:MAG: efflux RND transporter periplasmic adaptor subunit [Candidatus Omnitrophica bacterium]|nr:efflux RND transporter periplasmic adaptor subunit [Candidatus Omnitrophota bacterium]